MHRSTKHLVWLVLACLAACHTVSDQDIKRADLHRRLAESRLQRGQLELAIREYRASIGLNRKDPETQFGLGEAYRRKGMLDDSRKHFERALRYAPDHQDARLNLSVVYIQQERWRDAIRESTTLIDDPTFLRPSRALVNRGWAHYNSGNLTGAESDLREALLSDGANPQAHLNMGVVLFEMGKVEGSVTHLERVLELLARRPDSFYGPVEAQARYRLAKALIQQGQRTRAIEQLRVAAERGGQGEWGQKSRLYLGTLQ